MELNLKNKIIYIDGINKTNDVKEIIDKNNTYVVVYKSSTKPYSYQKNRVELRDDAINSKKNRDILEYYKEIATKTSLEIDFNDHSLNILGSQYDKLDSVNSKTVLSSFFNGTFTNKNINEDIIYPFGINQSQKKAVENAISNQISIIEGPPGTGKTQTILNIIANIIMNNQNVAVVSNNNSAITNVLDKLIKYDVNFISALLGNKNNRKSFIESQINEYPQKIQGWKKGKKDLKTKIAKVNELNNKLDELFDLRNKKSLLQKELTEYETENVYFKNHIKNENTINIDIKNIQPKKLMKFINEYENSESISIFKKIYLFFSYGKRFVDLYSKPKDEVINSLNSLFYNTKINELKNKIQSIDSKLFRYNYERIINELSEISLDIFKACLFNKYGERKKSIFLFSDLKADSKRVIDEHPVILSTTHSIRRSLSFDFIYDYLIIDESSQVDLVTGALAISCAKNVVIVGDNKQLPNVISQENKEIITKIDREYEINSKYRFIVNDKPHTLLDAALEVWPNIPSVLLKEHYRCEPKIINFCNEMFYDGQLVVMSEATSNNPLSLYLTQEGNHARGRYNQRQIDVIKEEIIPKLEKEGYKDIGIIAPYNDQVSELKNQLGEKYEIATVHKYQGREKEAIILSSVDNSITEFGDDPNLLNVAISRAKKSLSVVISNNKANWNTNYGKLKKYIEYNNLELIQSSISSVFDLLYKTKEEERIKYLKKKRKISIYDSENLLQTVIDDVLNNDKYKHVKCRNHYYISDIVSDYSLFCKEECNYIKNHSHIDFLFFDSFNKSPFAAIELDGTSFHQTGSIQENRDEIKNSIMRKINIPLLRIKTNESNEKEKIIKLLEEEYIWKK